MLVCPLCRIVLAKGEAVCPRDGQAPVTREAHPVPPSIAARFAIVEPFADGDAGTLYLADDKQTGRRGLLKVLRGASAWTVSERSRLKRELMKQATLTHPSLVVPLATGEADSCVWLFREWIDGVSLSVKIARSGALSVPEALAIAAQVASALDELHRAGLLMRDLSPGHVLVTAQPSGVPKVWLIDAGVAMRVAGGSIAEVTGKPGYVSPEHANGKLVSFRSDLYSLGCVVQEMLTGEPLFRGTTEQILEAQRTQAPPSIGASLPSGVASLIAQLLVKEPRDRPFSAQQVRRTLEPFLPDDGSGKRESTAAFAVGEHARRQIASPKGGSGTLRPPTGKRTLVGFGVPKPGAEGTQELTPLDLAKAEQVLSPRPDSTQELTSMDLGRAERVLGGAPPPNGAPPPFRRDADPTMQLTPGDLSVSRPARQSAPPPVPGPTRPKTAPPPPPIAAVHASPALAATPGAPSAGAARPGAAAGHPIAAPASPDAAATPATPSPGILPPSAAQHAAPQLDPPPGFARPAPSAVTTAPGVAAPPAAASGELDYDDLAETTALDRDAAHALLEAPGPAQAAYAPTVAAFPATPEPAPRAAPPAAHAVPPTAAMPAAAPSPVAHVATPAPGAADAHTDAGRVPGLGRPSRAPLWIAAGLVGFCGLATGTGLVGSFLWTQVLAPAPVAVPTQAPAMPQPAPAATPPAPAMPPAVAPAAPVIAQPTPLPPPAPTSEPVAVAPQPAPVEAQPEPAPVAAQPEPTPEPTRVAAADREPARGSTDRTPEPTRGSSRGSSSASSSSSTSSSSSSSSSGSGSGRPQIASTFGPRAGGSSSGAAAPAAAAPATSGPRTFDQLRADARAAFQSRRYDDAARAYEQASRMRPRDASVWAGLGAARLQGGDARAAIEAYRRAVSIEPRNVRYHVSIGRAFAAAGDRTRARQAFEHALQLDPSNRDARTQLDRL